MASNSPRARGAGAPRVYDGHTQVGVVATVHGIKGELRIRPMTDDPDYYLGVDRLHLEGAGGLKRFPVARMRAHKGGWIAELEGLDDRTEAEGWRGAGVFLEDSQLRPLDPGEFFVHDLVGCRVEGPDGEPLGEVVGFMETGANDVYVVRRDGREHLIPGTPEVVRELDVAGKRIVVEPLGGLFEN